MDTAITRETTHALRTTSAGHPPGIRVTEQNDWTREATRNPASRQGPHREHRGASEDKVARRKEQKKMSARRVRRQEKQKIQDLQEKNTRLQEEKEQLRYDVTKLEANAKYYAAVLDILKNLKPMPRQSPPSRFSNFNPFPADESGTGLKTESFATAHVATLQPSTKDVTGRNVPSSLPAGDVMMTLEMADLFPGTEPNTENFTTAHVATQQQSFNDVPGQSRPASLPAGDVIMMDDLFPANNYGRQGVNTESFTTAHAATGQQATKNSPGQRLLGNLPTDDVLVMPEVAEDGSKISCDADQRGSVSSKLPPEIGPGKAPVMPRGPIPSASAAGALCNSAAHAPVASSPAGKAPVPFTSAGSGDLMEDHFHAEDLQAFFQLLEAGTFASKDSGNLSGPAEFMADFLSNDSLFRAPLPFSQEGSPPYNAE